MKLHVDMEKRCGDFNLKVKFETSDEVFAILGASGCGKSLTLKCIAGIENPDKGIIRLGDKTLFDSEMGINLPARKRQIGYLFQDYALFPNMTVFQNIMCGAKDETVSKEYTERFYLKGKENLYPHQLSGGERQRVAIARMLAAKPLLVMFDEPFSALDSYLKTNLEREIIKVIERYDGQALFVSHDRDEVYRLTDRIAVMENGSIVGIQSKHELFEEPETLAAALLTGCKNVTEVKRLDDGSFFALDWQMKFKCLECKVVTPRFAGFQAHHFEVVSGNEEFNVVHCNTQRVVEDTRFINVQFTSDFGKETMTYTLNKEQWQKLKSTDLYLKMPENKIMIFE